LRETISNKEQEAILGDLCAFLSALREIIRNKEQGAKNKE